MQERDTLGDDLVHKKTITADVILEPAHVAVLSFVFYTGKRFPKDYRSSAFLVVHSSWNRSRRASYELAFIPFQHGKPSSSTQWDFMAGWMLSPGRRRKKVVTPFVRKPVGWAGSRVPD